MADLRSIGPPGLPSSAPLGSMAVHPITLTTSLDLSLFPGQMGLPRKGHAHTPPLPLPIRARNVLEDALGTEKICLSDLHL